MVLSKAIVFAERDVTVAPFPGCLPRPSLRCFPAEAFALNALFFSALNFTNKVAIFCLFPYGSWVASVVGNVLFYSTFPSTIASDHLHRKRLAKFQAAPSPIRFLRLEFIPQNHCVSDRNIEKKPKYIFIPSMAFSPKWII